MITASQPTRRRAAWQAARRAAAALRAIHHEQVLMWELSWQSGRIPVDRSGGSGVDAQPGRAPADRQPPARPRRRQHRGPAVTGTPATRLAASAEKVAAQAGRWREPE